MESGDSFHFVVCIRWPVWLENENEVEWEVGREVQICLNFLHRNTAKEGKIYFMPGKRIVGSLFRIAVRIRVGISKWILNPILARVLFSLKKGHYASSYSFMRYISSGYLHLSCKRQKRSESVLLWILAVWEVVFKKKSFLRKGKRKSRHNYENEDDSSSNKGCSNRSYDFIFSG